MAPSLTIAKGNVPALIAFVAVAVAATGVRAGEWRITPSASLEVAYNDNVNGATEAGDRDFDLVTSVSPGISVVGTGARLSLNLNYAPQRVIFLKDTSADEFRHTLSAAGNAELWRQIVFLDVAASVSQQIVDNQAPITATSLDNNPNRQTVQSYRISPVFRHHLGSWFDTEGRISLDRVITDDPNTSNATSYSTSFRADAGSRFSVLSWSLAADRSVLKRSGSGSEDRSDTANLDVRYNFSPQYAVVTTIGYEKVDDDTLTDEVGGIFWTAGVELNPGPRTSLTITYGDRFETEDIEFDLSYQLSSRTSITASLSESIQTSQGLLGNQLAFVATDANGNFIDTRTGLPFQPGDPVFGLEQNAFRQKRLSAAIVGTRGRNAFNAEAFYEKRDTDATGIEEIAFGGSATWSRSLSRRASASLSFSYTNDDFGTPDGREDNVYAFGANYSYQFARGLSSAVSYNFSSTDSNLGGLDIYNNVVTLSISKSF